MKRAMCLLLAILLMLSCSIAGASTMSDKYDEALELFMQKQYREAAAILDEISIYNDASQLSVYCKSIAEGSESNYSTAYMMLDVLGEYKDAKLWSIYFKACEAQEKGDELQAYQLFNSISLFRDSAEKLKRVQTGKNADFKKEYSVDSSNIGDGLIVIKKDDLCGYADLNGNIVLEPHWKSAQPFSNGYAIVASGVSTSYVINRNGDNVIHSYWNTILPKGEYFEVWEYDYLNSKMMIGLIDKHGKVLVEAKYDRVSVLGSDCFAIKKNDKYGIVDATGKIITDIKFDEIKAINDHLFAVKQDEKFGIIDPKGNEIAELVYESVERENNGLSLIHKDGKYGYMDGEGKIVIDLQYDVANSFNDNGWAKVQANAKWGYIDTEGNTVIPLEYDGVSEFSEGLAAVRRGEQYGYIDSQGNVALDFKWTGAGLFSNGIALVKDSTGRYLINQSGEKVANFPYDEAYFEPLKSGVSVLIGKDADGKYKYGLINNKGEIVLDLEYDRLRPLGDNFVIVRKGDYKDGKEGLVDLQGSIVFDIKYNSISNFDDDGHALVVGENNWFVIDTEGNIVF